MGKKDRRRIVFIRYKGRLYVRVARARMRRMGVVEKEKKREEEEES